MPQWSATRINVSIRTLTRGRRAGPRATRFAPGASHAGGAAPLPRRNGHPVRELAGERRERERAVAQHLIVEGPDNERRTVAGGELAAQPLDLALPDLGRQRMAGPGDVSIGLDRRVGLGEARIEQDPDAPGAVLPEGVDAGVHDQAGRTPGLCGQHPEPFAFAAEEPHLVGEPLRVEPPALGVRTGLEALLGPTRRQPGGPPPPRP